MTTRNVVLVDGVRTAFGKRGGTLRDFYPTQLCGIAIKGLLDKTKILEKAKVDAVYAGSAAGDVHCNNFARISSLYSGLPYETAAHFVEMQCGSGIACINHAAWEIAMGESDIVIAGGGESYSQRPVKFSTATAPYKGIAPAAVPSQLATEPDQCITMIEVSDLMAKRWSVTREECDEFAARSQQRAAAATNAGYFEEEIVPVIIPATRKTPEIVFKKDEFLRPDTTIEGLSKLKSVREGGVTTAGNASGTNDGASFVLMMSEETANKLGYKPLARWVCGAHVGCEPKYMGIGAAYAMLKAVNRASLTLDDIDVFECNEAFAAQNLACIREMESQTGLKIDQSKWNPNGGAISFGHPNGASGPRISIFTMKELQRRGGKYGVFSSCCGGGLGVACLVERV